jgi:hypothetical protein
VPGRRQHYLPQFLQRGFTSDDARKRTWLYRTGVAPREVGIRDVGVEEQFYSNVDDPALDDAITKIEAEEFSGAIEQMRNEKIGYLVNASVPKLVAHLEVRSRHFRAGFSETHQKLWTMTLAHMQEPGLVRQLLRNRYRRNPTALEGPANEQIESLGLPSSLASPVARIAMDNLLNADTEFFAPFWMQMRPLFEQMVRPRLQEAVRNAHRDALRRSTSPEIRVQQYQALRFEVVEFPSNDLVLGDSAVLFQVSGPRPFKPFLDKDDQLNAALLPLSANRLIVGVSSGSESLRFANLRHHIATCSHKFFIASQYSRENEAIATQIGLAALPLTDEDLREIVAEAITEEIR